MLSTYKLAIAFKWWQWQAIVLQKIKLIKTQPPPKCTICNTGFMWGTNGNVYNHMTCLVKYNISRGALLYRIISTYHLVPTMNQVVFKCFNVTSLSHHSLTRDVQLWFVLKTRYLYSERITVCSISKHLLSGRTLAYRFITTILKKKKKETVDEVNNGAQKSFLSFLFQN